MALFGSYPKMMREMVANQAPKGTSVELIDQAARIISSTANALENLFLSPINNLLNETGKIGEAAGVLHSFDSPDATHFLNLHGEYQQDAEKKAKLHDDYTSHLTTAGKEQLASAMAIFKQLAQKTISKEQAKQALDAIERKAKEDKTPQEAKKLVEATERQTQKAENLHQVVAQKALIVRSELEVKQGKVSLPEQRESR
jgi:hypothetical protein